MKKIHQINRDLRIERERAEYLAQVREEALESDLVAIARGRA
jgi:hypothetical protein